MLVLERFQKGVNLAQFTTFKIGGRAQYFFAAKNKNDLKKAVLTAKKNNLPFFILGGGSNILISDKGFSGLVIKNEARRFEIKGEKIFAESGVVFDRLVSAAVDAGLSGLEQGSGIPGTIGGAIYGNAGWPKGRWEIGGVVEEVELLMPNEKIKRVGKKWLRYQYRSSRLKRTRGEKPIILEVVLKLKKGKKEILQKKRQKILKIRSTKIPAGSSAGSVFKNPFPKSAGFLIEKCGLKGAKRGEAKISEYHANFIINTRNAKAKDVYFLLRLAKKEVFKKFKIKLQEEIELIGF